MTLLLKPKLSQVFTPAPVAQLMAAMLRCPEPQLRLLDAGAGIGSLTEAVVKMLCERRAAARPQSLAVTAYEVDPDLIAPLRETLDVCRFLCDRAQIEFTDHVICADFLEAVSQQLTTGLFTEAEGPKFNCVILNPPYRKIQASSKPRLWLRRLGVETSNLYTGFLAASIRLLDTGGEVVAITPRSFCSGSYFQSFRHDFLSKVALDRLHLFESRQDTFGDADVLQEAVIFHAVRNTATPEFVSVSGGSMGERLVPFSQVVAPGDPNAFIHIVPEVEERSAAQWMSGLSCTLTDLRLSVSTGRVVDFRARAFLRTEPDLGTVPLLYPAHLSAGQIRWPLSRSTKQAKAAYLVAAKETETLLIPNASYVLLRRFSTKEEKKRLVATLFEAGCVPGDQVGFENHLNYFHRQGTGLELDLARGLTAFLNSTLADSYFRQFNGHTQVNATDLRSFRYPSAAQLEAIGRQIGAAWDQAQVDTVLGSVINAKPS